ncbi:MAG TPA: IS630 family transposase [Planctomycetaceae bacterium]|jgi:transposase|nr:IS630 family transposase [Planctomycetaceae bacterium]HQZ65137.1 IS630 family transposase [Planctomycetaceae bacterium]HRA86465.1 IS630 family transposase [Planctomycetaceae bacterium]
MRVAAAVKVTDIERAELLRYSRGRRTEARVVLRAKVILMAAEGLQHKQITVALKTDPGLVRRWRARFLKDRIPGILEDAPRSGRKPSAKIIKEILRLTTQEKPEAATHWSTRTMAARVGVSHATVARIWNQHNLQPHRTTTFKISNDPKFEEKLHDVVGLYLSPPEHAIVLSVDEKSQIQALNRTQKSLPMFPGRLKTMTHDYKRNGTTTLFAAMNVVDGTVLADFKPRHRHREWLDFLKTIDATYPTTELHIICDNYATHKHDRVKKWLAKRPRIHIHFTPTSSSWMNLIERWFRDLTEKCIRRGSFNNVTQLETAIWNYIDNSNDTPKPFHWKATPTDILAKVSRARAALDKVQTE